MQPKVGQGLSGEAVRAQVKCSRYTNVTPTEWTQSGAVQLKRIRIGQEDGLDRWLNALAFAGVLARSCTAPSTRRRTVEMRQQRTERCCRESSRTFAKLPLARKGQFVERNHVTLCVESVAVRDRARLVVHCLGETELCLLCPVWRHEPRVEWPVCGSGEWKVDISAISTLSPTWSKHSPR